MKKLIAAAIAAIVLATTVVPAAAQERVQVGRLSCDVEGGIGYLIGSRKEMTCQFIRKGHRTETYHGAISKLGIDIGITDRTRLEWLVFAASGRDVHRGALAGRYVGGSAEASFGVGMGANWLIGGSRRSIALQPWSVQGTVGANFTWALAGLELR